MRPAEKLFEKLLIGSNPSGTDHPRILRADEDFLPAHALDTLVEALANASEQLDYQRARELLIQAVKEYKPSNGNDDLAWLDKSADGDSEGNEKVVAFRAGAAERTFNT